ncbi:class I alpha-mannosidase 1A [Aspergillus clavatus NRRL 1]|uniref:alpha-1,2-Mannosidase n=1 Tax=Aspergillus clavatus (strain ATCC 1007 / CBS 513.65 / DSM 816 / NCTC 3887 / NRRL 1 / QM 1276 / 107) TaxID=344612 RepID=A1CU78_ASPCL|nr:class I alpha-mannosidase 1A [Aspergillus clavatus NRRL 1]EAW06865.1 class I alpha-mannosidase 1A [Aspergillus clavatus NRRL 1]
MFRARRYRVSLVFAVIFVLIFIHFFRSHDAPASTVSVPASGDLPKTYPQHPPPPPPPPPPAAPESPPAAAPNAKSDSPSSQEPETPAVPDTKAFPDAASSSNGQEPSQDGSSASQAAISSTDNKQATGDSQGTAAKSELSYHGRARMKVDLPETNQPTPRWKQTPERFPVAPEHLIKLPTGQSKPLPRVQAAFKDETASDKIQRMKRLSSIRAAFEHAWNGYKASAMGHDELKPLRGGFRDPFMGWAATLVDSLDTLWIMDLKEEFAIAVDHVKKIDFTTSKREELPVFETVIRYLGGLLGAYDISGHKYDVLLDKAVELAEVVMGAFDTPNRMPTMFYKWTPEYTAEPHLADVDTTLAEIGSLSVEFTRLAQLTKQDKYYDAIARITNELEKLQGRTRIPGLWPLKIDASGCRVSTPQLNHELPRDDPSHTSSSPSSSASLSTSTPSSLSPSSSSALPSPSSSVPSSVPTPAAAQKARPLPTDAKSYTNFLQRRNAGNQHVDAQPATYDTIDKSSDASASPAIYETFADMDCTSGLNTPLSPKHKFGLGSRGDSTYEYLPKEYMILGGLNEQYPAMYKKAMESAREHLLFRPMVKDDHDIRFLSTMTLTHPLADQVPDSVSVAYEATHLSCFAGGMFALGAKVFGLEQDLEVAAQLTNGCIWAYGATKTGIMPDNSLLVPCPKGEPCAWNETVYWNALDPNEEKRIAAAKNAKEEKKDKRSTTPIHRRGSVGRWRVIADSETTDDLINPDEQEVKKDPEAEKAPHDQYVTSRILSERLPPGVTLIVNRAYLLRPEAIESVFYMFRITGDDYWREKGWEMFQAISKYTRTELAHSAIHDVTLETSKMRDTMESFWLAETLKYFYLLFSDPKVVSLDEYVL